MRERSIAAVEQKNAEKAEYREDRETRSKGMHKLSVKFIPPPFLSPPDSDINIKPSEYLKKVAARRSPSKCAKKSSIRNENHRNNGGASVQRSTSETHLVFDSVLISDWCTSRTKSEERENKRSASASPQAVVAVAGESLVCSHVDPSQLKCNEPALQAAADDAVLNKRTLKPIHGE